MMVDFRFMIFFILNIQSEIPDPQSPQIIYSDHYFTMKIEYFIFDFHGKIVLKTCFLIYIYLAFKSIHG